MPPSSATSRRSHHRGLGKSEYEAHGGLGELMVTWDKEVLLEGPANTGKTRGLLEKCRIILDTWPNLRMLWLRKTRKSLSQSVLVTWEEHVVGPGHDCITGTAKRANRDTYQWWNGGEIVLGGMDNPDKVMSSEYDFICYFEATEGTIEDWERCCTRTRNKRIPTGQLDSQGRPRYWAQLVADCNPGPEFHWLNKRAFDGSMHRIRTTHADNPTFTDDDQAFLDALTGVRRKRLRDGLWVSAEGQIWEEFDTDKHVVSIRDLLYNKDEPEAGLICNWYFGSMDYGHRNAGTLQIWGVDKDKRAFLVGEVYRKRKGIEWWANVIEKCLDKFELETIICDAKPEMIEYFNDRVGPLAGRSELPLVVYPQDKDRQTGIEMVRDVINDDALFICHDASMFGLCPLLKEEYKPRSLLEEIPAYVWTETKEGQYDKEEPDNKCEDHGCDALRYAMMFLWGTDLTPYHKNRLYAPETFGDLLDHEDYFEEQKKIEHDIYYDEDRDEKVRWLPEDEHAE